MERTEQGAETSTTSPGWVRGLRRLDEVVYAVELVVVVGSLVAMTLFVFVDVVYRRLSAPDSKLGALLAALTGVREEAGRRWIDAYLVPPLTLVLALGLLWFALRTGEARRGRSWLGRPWGAPLLASLGVGVLAVLGWSMLQPWMPSWAYYVLLAALITGGYAAWLARVRPSGWMLRFAASLLAWGGFSAVAYTYFPEGYSWSKEVSLVMLLWVGFVGASVCVHDGKHLRMEALERLVPERWRRHGRALGFLVTAAFCAFMAGLGFLYVFDPVSGAKALGGVFEQTGIPDWLAILAVPVGFSVAGARFLAAACSSWLGGSYGQPAQEEALQQARRLASESDGTGAEGAA